MARSLELDAIAQAPANASRQGLLQLEVGSEAQDDSDKEFAELSEFMAKRRRTQAAMANVMLRLPASASSNLPN